MKKTVLTFGLIAGAVLSLMVAITVPFHDAIGFDRGVIVGYTSMVLAFLLIFFGVRSYRDNVGGGSVRFGRAFAVGISIGAIASLLYVATWLVIFYNFTPDYMQKYQAHVLEKARAEGESAEAIAKKKAETDGYIEMYRNPFLIAATAFLEPLPVVLIVSLVSAGVLSRRRRGEMMDADATGGSPTARG